MAGSGTAHGAGSSSIPLCQEPSLSRRQELDHTPAKRSVIPKEAIQHLLEIRGLPESDFWKVAEAEWEKLEKEFTSRVAKSRQQISNVSNEIYQVVGFSAAFQGLLLTAASQGSSLTCNSKWWVLALSVFGTLAAVAALWEKNRIITFLQGSVKADDFTRKTYAVRLQELHERGPRLFDFDQVVDEEAGDPDKLPTNLQMVRRKVAKLIWPSYRYRILYCLVVFGILCALAIQYILCIKRH